MPLTVESLPSRIYTFLFDGCSPRLFLVAPLCAFLNNIFEIRIDAHKFVCDVRRPVAKKVTDIGMDIGRTRTESIVPLDSRYLAFDHCGHIEISHSDQCEMHE